MPGGGDQCYSERKAGGCEAVRRRSGTAVEQIYEIRIVAKVGVQCYRIGLDLRNRVDSAGSWQDQNANIFPYPLCSSFQIRQPIEGQECVHSRVSLRSLNNTARDREHCFGIPGEKVLQSRESLTHPGPLIEQFTCLTEWCVVDSHGDSTELLQSCTARANRNGVSESPKKSKSSLRGTPKRNVAGGSTSKVVFCASRRLRLSAGSKPEVTCITMLASAQVSVKIDAQSRVRHAGTIPKVLSRPRVGFIPTIFVNAAGTRPDPAVSEPNAKLTRPLATATAEPETRAAGNVAGIERIKGNAVWRSYAYQAGCKLIQVRLPDQNRTGVQELAYQRSGAIGRI